MKSRGSRISDSGRQPELAVFQAGECGCSIISKKEDGRRRDQPAGSGQLREGLMGHNKDSALLPRVLTY